MAISELTTRREVGACGCLAASLSEMKPPSGPAMTHASPFANKTTYDTGHKMCLPKDGQQAAHKALRCQIEPDCTRSADIEPMLPRQRSPSQPVLPATR